MVCLFSQCGNAPHQAGLHRSMMLPMSQPVQSQGSVPTTPMQPISPLPCQASETCRLPCPFSKHLSALPLHSSITDALAKHKVTSLLSAPVTTYFSELYCLVFSTHQYPFLLLSVCARCISIKSICQAKNLYCYICISLA